MKVVDKELNDKNYWGTKIKKANYNFGFKADIFDANFVNTHFTNFYDEI